MIELIVDVHEAEFLRGRVGRVEDMRLVLAWFNHLEKVKRAVVAAIVAYRPFRLDISATYARNMPTIETGLSCGTNSTDKSARYLLQECCL